MSFPYAMDFSFSRSLDPHIIKGERPFFLFLQGLPYLTRPWNLHSPGFTFGEHDSTARRFKLYPCVETPTQSPIGARIPDPDQLTWRSRIRGRHQAWAELKTA